MTAKSNPARDFRRGIGGSAESTSGDLARYRFADACLPSGLILDDGCGHGNGTEALVRPDRRVIAVDPDRHAVRARLGSLEPHLEFRLKESPRFEFPDMYFDGVVSLEVVEHVVDSVEYIRELARVAKPKGTLVLSTPNRRVLERYYIRGRSPVNITHFREFYPEELRGLLSPYFRIDQVLVSHACDVLGRQRSLEYQMRFPIPYELRAKIPLSLRSLWMEVRGRETPSECMLEPTDWETLRTGESVKYEDIIVVGSRNNDHV